MLITLQNKTGDPSVIDPRPLGDARVLAAAGAKTETLGQYAGGVAHDLNNLLTVINCYAEVLIGDLPTSDPRYEWLTAIRTAGERAASLSLQLLAFSRQFRSSVEEPA